MKINRIKKLIIYLEIVLIEFDDRLNLGREVNDSEISRTLSRFLA